MAEQIALDIDREILGALTNARPRSNYPEDFKNWESYREEILVKKYGFR